MYTIWTFFSQMIKLNNEQIIIVNDILYWKNKYTHQNLYIILTRNAWTKKTFTLMCITKYATILY
jgi:hypothetical protein